MKIFDGKSVFGGVAIGRISVLKKKNDQVKSYKIADVEAEVSRYITAKEEATVQLKGLYDKALKEVGEANAAIFEIHQMMLADDDYNDAVENIISAQCINAEYAVATTRDNFAQMFLDMDDEYMKGRAADVKDISNRLINILSGDFNAKAADDDAVIVLATDLAPSETVQLDKDKVLSFVTTLGSINSHSAILARTMAIPALVATNIPEEDLESFDGKLAAVDASAGKIFIEPDDKILTLMRDKQEKDIELKELYQTLKGKPSVTADGKRVMLYANIGNIKDLALVINNDAEGIGLFRSEFIYLEKDRFPTEEEQFQIYKTVAETMAGKRVIIRTLDIGADKRCDYFNMPSEENPAMGCRAIRICLTRPEIFKTQLRALFRASCYGRIAIMYPMITSVSEVRRIKEIVALVKSELDSEGIAFGNPEQGIMIETPAAVMISDELAKEVDFFSIGTNDLTQYSLAIDRQNQSLDEFFDPHHKAIIRMIEMVVNNSHDAGIWTGICGELGADLELTEVFLRMGIDELSVSPGKILPVRKKIIETNVSQL